MFTILQQITTTLTTFSIIDWIGLIAGVIYVSLAAKENSWCWLFGILSCACIAYADFTKYQLYADGSLQIYYVLIGFYGWYQWRYGNSDKKGLKITTLTPLNHLLIIGGGIVLTFPMYFVFTNYTDAALPLADSITTTFSVITTILVTRKILGNWLYWIVIDIAYIFIYAQQQAYLFTLLMVVYLVIAIVGYWNWKRIKNHNLFLGN